MEITIDVLDSFNKENNTKYTVEEWEKSIYINFYSCKKTY